MTPLPAVGMEHRLSLPDAAPPPPPRARRCEAPICTARVDHRHHVLGRRPWGTIDWILIDDDLVRVVTDLCWQHHDNLESQPWGAKARLRYLRNIGWGWYKRATQEEASEGKERIWWVDHKSQTGWIFVGFLKGERWIRLPTP